MNRRIAQFAIALGGWLTATALAGEAPFRTELPPAPVPDLAGMLSSMPAAFRPPPTDPAAARMVWDAVVDRFPEIIDGPERGGVFFIAIALRENGGVVASDMRYIERHAIQGLNEVQRELNELLPQDSRQVLAGLESTHHKAAVIPGDRVLKGEVRLIARRVTRNWEAERDSGIVRRAVLANHQDLFLPMSGDHINQLTVVMAEDGTIARHKVQPLAIEQLGNSTRIHGGCGPLRPGVPPEILTRAIAELSALGVEPEHAGLVGTLRVTLPPDQAQLQGGRTIGADGIARGQPAALGIPSLNVCYVWPRRPGEPIGGTPLVWESVPDVSATAPQRQQVSRLVEQYFPEGSPAKGNWMLLTHEGQVVRTGHVALANDETLTNVFLERMFPGIRINATMSTSRTVMPKMPGEMPGAMINVTVAFLAADSPFPPPEDMPRAAE